MNPTNPALGLGLAMLLASAAPAPVPAQTPSGSLTIDRIADIKYPTGGVWSPDGARVAFLWDAAGKQDLFVVTPGEEPVQLTDFPVDPALLITDIGALAWASTDEILFGHDGQLWRVSPEQPGPERVQGLSGAGSFVLSPDRKKIAFTRDGHLWLAALGTGHVRQLTFLQDLDASSPVFSPDGEWIAFTGSRTVQRQYPLPFNGNIVRSYQNFPEESRVGVVSTLGANVWWVPVTGRASDVQFAGEGSLLYQEISPDRKTRELKVVEVGGVPRTLWTDHDPRWWSPVSRDQRLVLVSPDGRSVAFSSDREGWLNLYVMPLDATSDGQARQLTSGAYLSAMGSWSPDSRRIAYHHGVEGNPMERFIDVIDVTTGRSEPVVTEPGLSFNPAFSPDGSRLLYNRTDPRNPLDLYVVDVAPRSASIRLSDSMTPGIDRDDMTVPVAVQFPSRHDGAPVPATLMVHDKLDRSSRHPAIVWAHGSGSDQNYLAWHPGSYRMYYAVHQYLAQQGYVILTPDYRGSSGYSRDWATGHHMSIGVTDSEDVAAGADYLKTLDYVDPDRICVWGLSYGGFMTLQALWRDPTLWRCGINVAGVVDWTERGMGMNLSGFTIPRLGSPADNPEVYEVSAPVNHMDRLERPLLVMHGTDDRNVAFHDSLILIDRLIKLGKPFETVIYPGEIHFFRRAIVLRDAWRRVEAFFDEHLKRGVAMSSR